MTYRSDPDKEDELRIRNRAHLPASRSLTISVTWLRLPGVMLLTLALSGVFFLIGVMAGSGGWYRETVLGLTRSFPEGSYLQQVLLAPDQISGETPSMRDRLAEIEFRLDVMAESVEDSLAKYQSLASTYSTFTLDLKRLGQATNQMLSRTEAARSMSESTRNQLNVLILAVAEAQRARAQAADERQSQQMPRKESPDANE